MFSTWLRSSRTVVFVAVAFAGFGRGVVVINAAGRVQQAPFHWSCFAARGCPASMCRAALTAVLVGSMSVAAGHTLLRAPQRASLAVLRMSASDADLSKLTVVQLKERLRAAGLPLSGRKAELIARLSETASAPAAALVQAAPVPAANLLSGLLETGATAVLPLIEIEACKS